MKLTVQMQIFADGDPVTDLNEHTLDTRQPWTLFNLNHSGGLARLWQVRIDGQNGDHPDDQSIRGWWPFMTLATWDTRTLCSRYTPGILYMYPSDCPSVVWMPNTIMFTESDYRTPPTAWTLMLRTIASEVPTP